MQDLPQPNEIEISIFGESYGESIVIHVGNNNWIIIDSCFDIKSKYPTALNYLHKLGVNPKEVVKVVVASHWHDDHIRGFAKLVEECENATFVCSEAFLSEETLAFLEARGSKPMIEGSSGVQELYHAFKIVYDRLSVQKIDKDNIIKFASANKCLWQRDLEYGKANVPCSLHSLSPSDIASMKAKEEFSKFIPSIRESKKRIPSQSANDVSVALIVKVGNHSMLLGSDLEETTHPGTGWSVIVNSKERPQEKATVFKIPHHGSVTAHNSNIWDKLLVGNAFSGLTPWVLCGSKLPAREDVDRIWDKSKESYATASLKTKAKKDRDKIVKNSIEESTKNIYSVLSNMGQIRFRNKIKNEPNNWDVELFGGAIPLNKIYT